MNRFIVFTKEDFLKVCRFLNVSCDVDFDYVYEVYRDASEGIEQLTHDNEMFNNIDSIDPMEILQYSLGEYLYSVSGRTSEQVEAFKKDEKIKESMTSVVADKYLSLSKFEHRERKLTSKYYPPISSLSIYVNFMLNILNNYKKENPTETLITDLLFKSLSIMKCSMGLIVDGFETEAFSSWRTLHECECTLILLDKYGEPLINRYLKHMEFGIAFRDSIPNKEKQNEIFNRMKEEMRGYGLKSKDIKKYIEYGWLYGIENVDKDPNFKLNFRDGLEKLAGLETYNHRYEMSSEIIHSTPMLIYSNRIYFHFITSLSLYESFFRLEKVFVNLFIAHVAPEAIEGYRNMRNVYYAQLVNIHKREVNEFNAWSQANTQKK